MSDRETIIKGCENWVNTHEGKNYLLTYSSVVELLALLKEQEEERLKFIEAVARLTAENETMKMIYGDQGKIVGELVRCNDCKHFEPDGVYTMCYRHNGLSPNEEWFCADGERK